MYIYIYVKYIPATWDFFPESALEFDGCTRDPRATVYHITTKWLIIIHTTHDLSEQSTDLYS